MYSTKEYTFDKYINECRNQYPDEQERSGESALDKGAQVVQCGVELANHDRIFRQEHVQDVQHHDGDLDVQQLLASWTRTA